MSAPLSNELFFDAHRGIRLRSGNNFKIDKSALGMHWSTDETVAQDFGGRNYMPEDTRVIHAKIPLSSVETDPTVLKERGVVNPHTPHNMAREEAEVPVKSGAPVYVTGTSKLKEIPGKSADGRVAVKVRRRTYNPPREMKA